MKKLNLFFLFVIMTIYIGGVFSKSIRSSLKEKSEKMDSLLEEINRDEDLLEDKVPKEDGVEIEEGLDRAVSDKWRQEISTQFYDDVSILKNIIIDGETDKEELDDFLSLFKQQRDWFDKTITGTKNFFDPKYNAVMQKKGSFQRVVKAQEVADQKLQELVSRDEVGDLGLKRLRLIVLYDLNALIQKQVEKGLANELPTGISESEITDVVKKVVSDFKEKRITGIDVEQKVADEVKKLETELKKLKKELARQKKQQIGLEGEMKERLEEKNKVNLELEILLEKTKRNMVQLKREESERTRLKVENEFKKIVEDKNKRNLNLQLKLKELKNELKKIQRKLYFWQNEAEREGLKRGEAEKKVDLFSDINRRRARILQEESKKNNDQRSRKNVLNERERYKINARKMELEKEILEKKQMQNNKYSNRQEVKKGASGKA